MYSKELKVFRRWNRIGAISLVFTVACFCAIQWIKPFSGIGNLVLLVSAALFAYSLMRVVLFQCSRCGKPFSLTLRHGKSTGRTCAHCNLTTDTNK